MEALTSVYGLKLTINNSYNSFFLFYCPELELSCDLNIHWTHHHLLFLKESAGELSIFFVKQQQQAVHLEVILS